MLGTYFVFTLILFILSIVGVVWSYKGDIDTEIKNPLILAMENYKVLSPTLKIISFLFHLSSQRGFFVARNQPESKKRRRKIKRPNGKAHQQVQLIINRYPQAKMILSTNRTSLVQSRK